MQNTQGEELTTTVNSSVTHKVKLLQSNSSDPTSRAECSKTLRHILMHLTKAVLILLGRKCGIAYTKPDNNSQRKFNTFNSLQTGLGSKEFNRGRIKRYLGFFLKYCIIQ